ncbi:MAG TPA: porin, partial [Isosphaeraceae bacterium]|nr:porin [Isosphaeraceae bacterium]
KGSVTMVRRPWISILITFLAAAAGPAGFAQESSPTSDSEPVPTNAQLLQRLQELEAQVKEVQDLREQVKQVPQLNEQIQYLQGELSTLRENQTSSLKPPVILDPSVDFSSFFPNPNLLGASIPGQFGTSPLSEREGVESNRPSAPGGSNSAGGGGFAGSGGFGAGESGYQGMEGSPTTSREGSYTNRPSSPPSQGDASGSKTGGPEDDDFPLKLSYKYNFGGGYTQLSDDDGEFTLKFQNQLTADGTFYDRQNIPTSEKGFNVPFQRAYLYGNITKNWEYQLAEQGFLGSFNLLDMFINAHFSDKIQFKFGRMLSPFLYEYYGFSPAWEPVITNSPLFQLAGKRQIGAMFWGQLFDQKLQYQAGIYNGIDGGFFDFDRNKDFLGAITLTPFKDRNNSIFQHLGAGVGVQTGWQNYMLNRGDTANFINGAGEPTLNDNFITSTGVPFFQYNADVRAMGNRTKIAPHFFWFGRFSILAEYLIQSRELADSTRQGTSVQRGYYVNASYFLTGERYNGDGLGGYTTISPIHPFMPSQGKWGPGAWEIAAQFSELNVGTGDFQRGFADPNLYANRLDQLMVGMNWWPNKWTRISFDWVFDEFNRTIPLGGGNPVDRYNILWTRFAMFF